ncbi:Radical SAM superfamily protein [Desulfonatronum thiosulfatophilum]|uniref:Radical SAM superfamily protein n=2 Tax=Desulfonatronum thiosulfatophilum TaxID=617002 RepID=A0A1G6DIS5_9BACT|nr:Radical SAM superfamily protein [Desulfonatronum thiosulfatophilum]
MTYWYPGVTAMVHLLRRIWPKVPIVLGGVYATLCPEHAKSEEVDLVLQGPFEEPRSWGRFWRLWGMSAPPIPPDAGLHLALDLYDRPDFSVLLGSRGCPFRCSYCASGQLFSGFRRRSPESLFSALEQDFQRGVRDFAFQDDALLVDAQSWLVPWLEMTARLKSPVRLHTPNAVHIRYLNQSLCTMMRKARFVTIRLGLETSSFAHRNDQKLDAEHWERGVRALFSAGFQSERIGVYILSGLPGQEFDDVVASVRFVRSFGLQPHLAHYSPIPGTQLFQQACAASDHPLASEPLFHNPSLWPCVPGGFSPERQRNLQRLLE